MILFLLGVGAGLMASAGIVKLVSEIKKESFHHGYEKAKRETRGSLYHAGRYLDIKPLPPARDRDLVFKEGSVVDEDGTVLAAVGVVRG